MGDYYEDRYPSAYGQQHPPARYPDNEYGYAPPPGLPPEGYYAPPGQSGGGYQEYPPPPGPPPGEYTRDSYGQEFLPPPGPPPGQYYDYDPPTGVPPPDRYQQTGAGFVPPTEYEQAPYPPYGAQYQGEGSREQAYGPAFIDHDTGAVAQPYFEYSRCTGKKKALLIGINYIGSDNQLEGCINDARNVERFICERFGYDPSDIVILTDDAEDDRQYPSRENMLRAMQWLVDGAEQDDALFFHYSGHGTQVPDEDGDEQDGYNEGNHAILVTPLPPGCRLTAIFDSCHSGSVLDLPYLYTTDGKIKEPDLFAEAQAGLLSAGRDAIRGDSGGVLSGLLAAAKGAWGAEKAAETTRRTKTAPADVIQWGGCADNQTAFIAALTKYPQQSYQQLLETLRDEMRGRYTQKPQLSACHPIDTELMFVA
ncbi:Ca(2+)-dependent cysteine protease [Cryptotrichosporon argae]